MPQIQLLSYIIAILVRIQLRIRGYGVAQFEGSRTRYNNALTITRLYSDKPCRIPREIFKHEVS